MAVELRARLNRELVMASLRGVPGSPAAPMRELVALLMVVETAMVTSLNIGGWGPREGVAASALAAAGLCAAAGVKVTTLYAVLTLVALGPGAGLFLADAVRRRRQAKNSGESLEPDPEPKRLEAIGG